MRKRTNTGIKEKEREGKLYFTRVMEFYFVQFSPMGD